MAFIGQFFAADSAATAIEYGLIAPGAAVAILAVVVRLRTALNTALPSVGASSK
jgi:Flp pilus assembly pilin Flp